MWERAAQIFIEFKKVASDSGFRVEYSPRQMADARHFFSVRVNLDQPPSQNLVRGFDWGVNLNDVNVYLEFPKALRSGEPSFRDDRFDKIVDRLNGLHSNGNLSSHVQDNVVYYKFYEAVEDVPKILQHYDRNSVLTINDENRVFGDREIAGIYWKYICELRKHVGPVFYELNEFDGWTRL